MAAYRITIYGHLDVWKLPPDGSLPPIVRQVFNVEADDIQMIAKFVDERMGDIAATGAMKVLVNPDHKTLGKLEPWISIPLHMLTHNSFKVAPIVGELPIYDPAKGESILTSGEDVVKQ